jgi:hypothetical protein
MDKKRRLFDLLGDINFKIIDNRASAAEFREKALYNQSQYAKIEARGDHYEERIIDLMSLILADKLQPVIINRFGNTSDYSLYLFFREQFTAPKMQVEWGKFKHLALEAISDEGLDDEQMEIVSRIIDGLPELLIDFLACLTGRLKVVPMQENTDVSMLLARMMMERNDADNTGYNQVK